MKALIKEFLYERNSILLAIGVSIALYICYIYFLYTPEPFLCYLTTYMVSSLYSGIIFKRKSINWEIYLSTTPIGKKTIINTAYFLSAILSLITVFIYFILYLIRTNLNIGNPLIVNNKFLSIDITSLPAIFGIGLITNAILLPISIFSKEDSKFLQTAAAFLTLGFCFVIIKFIFSLEFINIIWQNLIVISISIIICLVSYYLVMDKYLKKEL